MEVKDIIEFMGKNCYIIDEKMGDKKEFKKFIKEIFD